MPTPQRPFKPVWLWLCSALPALAWAQPLPPAHAATTQLAEHGHHGERGHGQERGHDRRGDERSSMEEYRGGGRTFTPMQQHVARNYYLQDEHRGFVPPGLAKKGGMPPGQYKRWRVGYPLPTGVVYYALPGPLMLELGPPPAGYRYVRVATDILLIAIGTGLVVDAIEDIVR